MLSDWSSFLFLVSIGHLRDVITHSLFQRPMMISSLGMRSPTASHPAQSFSLRQDTSPNRSHLIDNLNRFKLWLLILFLFFLHFCHQVTREDITSLLLIFSSSCRITTTEFIKLTPLTFLSEVFWACFGNWLLLLLLSSSLLLLLLLLLLLVLLMFPRWGVQWAYGLVSGWRRRSQSLQTFCSVTRECAALNNNQAIMKNNIYFTIQHRWLFKIT